ncbi:molecular chaperone, partial [Mycobacterium sp. 852013-51886_SCH5428379]|uniref:Hsp70 family protein n=1 Tax=Mycobacterium sp. 852013-51886_SCH5428379 TaxID=1834111 RepID=UPI0007FDBF40
MSDPLGLSIGTTNLVAARVGNPPVIRRSTLSLFSDRTPQVGLPPSDDTAGAGGTVLTGFVERVGDPVPLVAPDGSSYHAEALLTEALDALVELTGGPPLGDLAIAVPAHWGTSTQFALRKALRTNPVLAPARLVPDAVASLTALHANPGLPSSGVVALVDLGGSGTSITVADASAAFEAIDATTRLTEFSGDQIDQALLGHVLHGITQSGGVDPASTTAVGSLTALRDQCRMAKERLSAQTAADVAVDLPGHSSQVRVTRAELEDLLRTPLAAVLSALDDVLQRNRIAWANVSAVVTIGGGASIPLVTQQLSAHTRVPVVTTPQPALDAAVGAALFAAYGATAEAPTGLAPAVPVTEMSTDAPGSATFRALAWSQDEGAGAEPVPYTDDAGYPDPYQDPYDAYATEVAGPRPEVLYEPHDPPADRPSVWQRLPQLAVAAAAVVAIVALGGVAYALTGTTTDSTPATQIETTRVPASAPLPPPTEPPPPPVLTVTLSLIHI